VPERRRIGVLGSLCNPPHRGHVALAEAGVAAGHLDAVLLVPTGRPAHRAEPAESAATRLALARAAAADAPVLEVSTVEIDRPGPSYMADTLDQLAAAEPGAALVLLLGADQYAALDRWHAPERIRARAEIAVAPRPGAEVALDGCLAIPMAPLDVSSSLVRARVAAGEPIDALVTPAVAGLIGELGLYRSGDGG
jgi:nicotinate-nucleotide adenylyltransferase